MGQRQKPGNAATKPGSRSPKSMVIRIGAGEVGPSVSQLVRDVRTMMEPETATRLRERKSNRLRDYTTMAGPLGVTHLLLFSMSASGNVNMRLAVTPRGPTLHFRVEKYSLCKDVHQSQRRPRSVGNELHTAPPLLVMNNFTTQKPGSADGAGAGQKDIPKHLESLTTTIFQSLFPPINPMKAPLKGIKRVLLLDRTSETSGDDKATYYLNLRHYAIETRTAKSIPKPLRKLDEAAKTSRAGEKRKRGAFPDLGHLTDVSDFLLDQNAADGFTSGSESEPETDAEVEVVASREKARKRTTRNGKPMTNVSEPRSNVQKKGIKLHELGPRLRLRLTKVEEGLCEGKIMWHEYIHKSATEVKQLEKMHEERRREKARRKAEQHANVERKKTEKNPNEAPSDEEDGADGLFSDADDGDDVWLDETAVDEDGEERAESDESMEDAGDGDDR